MKKKTIALILAVILSLTCLGGTISAIALDNTTALEIENIAMEQESDKMFGNLFFTNFDDINKIIDHFDSTEACVETLSVVNKIDVKSLIEELDLKTNYEETVCIIANVYEAAEYVESEEACENSAVYAAVNASDDGSIAQPYWSMSNHKDMTVTVAKKYFSTTVATKLGDYDKEVDTKYSSVTGYIFNTPQQYIHFNEYTDGDDSRDYVAAMWLVSSSLAWKNGQKEDAYMYLGYALHPLQDKEAHGQIGAGKSRPQHLVSYVSGDNISHADDKTGWEWTDANRNKLKSVSGSTKRYNAAVKATEDILKEYSGILK